MSPGIVLDHALRAAPPGAPERAELGRLRRGVAVAIGSVLLVLTAWTLLAPINGAVIATGVVKSERDRKIVRHQEGGIVRDILVREGQQVSKGEALIVIGDVRTDALLSLHQDQLASESVRHARLEAELALAQAFALPASVADGAATKAYAQRERLLFDARRRTLQEQLASLTAQVAATDAQIAALARQVQATADGARLAQEELGLNRDLLRDGFVQRTRVLTLERAVTDYDSRAAEQASELELARQRRGELQLRAVQARNQYQQQAATELKESTARLREIEEQLRPAQDVAQRQYVRSPVDGEVMSLHVGAAGAVVGPREPLLEVVPAREPLVVEARVEVADIEHVRVGGEAEVRLSAYEYRAMPMLAGKVTAVSADRVLDERTGLAWFAARIEVDLQGLQAYAGAEMRAGMPAEVFVRTEARTLLEYVAGPLTAFARRGLREP